MRWDQEDPHRYLKPGSEPFAELPDGTPLYPAYDRLRPGERYRRRMDRWNGAIGAWVAVAPDGRLFRQRKLWGGDEPRPEKWEPFIIGNPV